MRAAFLVLIGFQVTVILYLKKKISVYYASYAKNIMLALHFKREREGKKGQSGELILEHTKRQKQTPAHRRGRRPGNEIPACRRQGPPAWEAA